MRKRLKKKQSTIVLGKGRYKYTWRLYPTLTKNTTLEDCKDCDYGKGRLDYQEQNQIREEAQK